MSTACHVHVLNDNRPYSRRSNDICPPRAMLQVSPAHCNMFDDIYMMLCLHIWLDYLKVNVDVIGLSFQCRGKLHDWLRVSQETFDNMDKTRTSCQKGPTRPAYAWRIGPFLQDTLDNRLMLIQNITHQRAITSMAVATLDTRFDIVLIIFLYISRAVFRCCLGARHFWVLNSFLMYF